MIWFTHASLQRGAPWLGMSCFIRSLAVSIWALWARLPHATVINLLFRE